MRVTACKEGYCSNCRSYDPEIHVLIGEEIEVLLRLCRACVIDLKRRMNSPEDD